MGSERSFAEGSGNTTMDSAEKRLNELGYKQELRREMVCEFYFVLLFFFTILCLMELIMIPVLSK